MRRPRTAHLTLIPALLAGLAGPFHFDALAAQGLAVGIAPEAAGVRWSDGIGLEDALFYGGVASLEFGRFVSLTAGYREAGSLETDFVGAGYTEDPTLENRVDAGVFGTAVLLRLGPWRLAPLLVGSGGVLRLTPDGRDPTNQIFVGWGGGVGARITSRFEGRLLLQDVRFRADRAQLAGLAQDETPPEDPDAGSLRSNLTASLSLGARLGGGSSRRADALDEGFGDILEGSGSTLLVPLEIQAGLLRFDDALGLGDRTTVGVEGGVDLGLYFGLRGAYWRALADGTSAFGDVAGWSAEAQFSLGPVTGAAPFLRLGYGQMLFADDLTNDAGFSVPDQGVLVLAGGFGYPLSDRMRLTVSARDLVSTTAALDRAATPSDLRHTLGLTAGLSVLLRGHRTRGPAAPGVAPVPTSAPAAGPEIVLAPVGAPASPGESRPDSAAGYQSEKSVTLPVPSVGELYVRYGPPEQRGSPVGVEQASGPAAAPAADSAGLAAIVRQELARALGPVPTTALDSLEARLLERLRAGGAPATEVERSTRELRDLEERVQELTRIVRESVTLQALAGASRPPATVLVPGGVVTRTEGPDRPFFRGAELRAGSATIRDGGVGVGAAFELSLGSLSWRALRPFLGLEAGRSSVRTTVGGSSVIGSVTSAGASAGTFVDLPAFGPLRPSISFGLGGLGGGVHGDSPQDAELMDRLYGGFHMGPAAGLHVGYRRADLGGLLLTGAVRRLWAGPRSRWAVEVGARLPGREPRAPGAGASMPGVMAPSPAPAGAPPPSPSAPAPTPAAPAAEPAAAPAPAAPDSVLLLRLTELEEALGREAGAREQAEAAARAREEAADRARAEAADGPGSDGETDAATLRRSLEELVGVLPDVLAVRRTQRGLEVTVGGGAFAVGAALLSDRARNEVERVASLLRGSPGAGVLVDGHTDATGDAGANLELSRQRAEAVRGALLAAGLPPERVVAFGSGESAPIAENTSAVGRARNRRVEIVLLGLDAP